MQVGNHFCYSGLRFVLQHQSWVEAIDSTKFNWLFGADNVGDNVGDIAGMGADLFGSFAESTCAALVISSVSSIGQDHIYSAMSFPLLISAAGIIVCLLTTFIATDLRPARMVSEIENTLKYQLIISTLIATPVCSSAPVVDIFPLCSH